MAEVRPLDGKSPRTAPGSPDWRRRRERLSGSQASGWGSRFGGAHGLSRVVESGTEYLWLTDEDDGLVGYLGENESHDAAVDGAGNVYVSEWIVGGRITKLRRVD